MSADSIDQKQMQDEVSFHDKNGMWRDQFNAKQADETDQQKQIASGPKSRASTLLTNATGDMGDGSGGSLKKKLLGV